MAIKSKGTSKSSSAGKKSRAHPPTTITSAVSEHNSSATPAKTPAAADFYIVGIGASAGGLEAFSNLLAELPLDTGMAFVLIAHLAPEHDSALTQILTRSTRLSVSEITDNQKVLPNHVYVIPRDVSLSIVKGVLRLSPRSHATNVHRPIDVFFESLAHDRGARSIGIVLSGTGSDGSLGLEAIKAEGGITFAQDNSAKHDSMPRSAVAAGCVDQVLSPAAIAKELGRIASHPYVAGQAAAESLLVALHDAAGNPQTGVSGTKTSGAANSIRVDYQRVLQLLHKHSGVDFSFYKIPTILRRINRRLLLSQRTTLADYAKYLNGNVAELDALYADVLINVTSFFRDPEMFDFLQRQIFAQLLKESGDDPLRCWVLGCSSGQEAYSIAISFLEAAEESTTPRTLQIFATDLSEAQLNKARQGLYPKSLAEEISPTRLRRFFEEEENGYRIRKPIRQMIVFARQNLANDPPFSRMDIISCRNLLIYLETSLQKKALPTFHYALKPGGYLVLGKSESIGEFSDLFTIVDKKHKIFRKNATATPSLHLPLGRSALPISLSLPPASAPQNRAAPAFGELNARHEADRLIVNRFAPPAVLVSDGLQVLQFRGATGVYLEPPSGKANYNVLKMARDGLMLPLRAAVNQAREENKTTRRESITLKYHGETRLINLEVIPLMNLRERSFLILFEDTTQPTQPEKLKSEKRVRERRSSPNPPTKQERNRISELEMELRETRDYLQTIQEQHEATVEALEAASEEVQSTNEELQSVNEELETSKEELESSNEELITVNEEMISRNVELNRLNNDLINFQASTRISILLLGNDLTLRRFSPQAQKQFDLVASDLERPIQNIRHGLFSSPDSRLGEHKGRDAPIDLAVLAAEVIANNYEQQYEVVDRNGYWYSMRLRPYITHEDKLDGVVVLFLGIDALKHGEQEMIQARYLAEDIIATVREPLLLLDSQLRVESANPAFYRLFHSSPKQTLDKLIFELGNHEWDIPRLRHLLSEILPRSTILEDFQIEHRFEHIGQRTMLLNARRVEEPQGRNKRILLAIEDVTNQQRTEQELRSLQSQLRACGQEINRFCIAAINRDLSAAELKQRLNDLYDRLGQPLPDALEAALDGKGDAATNPP